MQALSDVGQMVGSSLVLDEVLSNIIMNAVRFSGCDGGSVMEYVESERCFTVRSAYASSPELLARLRSSFRTREVIRRMEQAHDIVVALANAVEAKDLGLKDHCRYLAYRSARLAAYVGLRDGELEGVAYGALLHDIGKIGIPDSVLLKPGRLTDAEYDGIVARLGREPNGLELAVFSLMWSEHCGYKHSRKLLRRLPTEGPHVLMGPGENAGVVDAGDGLAFDLAAALDAALDQIANRRQALLHPADQLLETFDVDLHYRTALRLVRVHSETIGDASLPGRGVRPEVGTDRRS